MAKQDEQQDEHEQEQDGQQESVRVVAQRPVIEVAGAVGGWPYPWPNVTELASALPADRWTLIGGLMAQMHAINRGIDAVRPTNDVDIVLHIETERGTPRATVAALERIGYRMLTSIDPLNPTAHRFTRGTSHVDVIGGDTTMEAKEDQIDVVIADHPAPSVEETDAAHGDGQDRGRHPGAQADRQLPAQDHSRRADDNIGASAVRRAHLEGGRLQD